MLNNLISVCIGGAFGSLIRYLFSILSKRIFMTSIYGTFFVNILGCFLMGYVFALLLNKIDALPQSLKLLITVGFLGGLTTFSTLNIEVFELIKSGKILYGFLYLFLSCFVGLMMTYFGYWVKMNF